MSSDKSVKTSTQPNITDNWHDKFSDGGGGGGGVEKHEKVNTQLNLSPPNKKDQNDTQQSDDDYGNDFTNDLGSLKGFVDAKRKLKSSTRTASKNQNGNDDNNSNNKGDGDSDGDDNDSDDDDDNTHVKQKKKKRKLSQSTHGLHKSQLNIGKTSSMSLASVNSESDENTRDFERNKNSSSNSNKDINALKKRKKRQIQEESEEEEVIDRVEEQNQISTKQSRAADSSSSIINSSKNQKKKKKKENKNTPSPLTPIKHAEKRFTRRPFSLSQSDSEEEEEREAEKHYDREIQGSQDRNYNIDDSDDKSFSEDNNESVGEGVRNDNDMHSSLNNNSVQEHGNTQDYILDNNNSNIRDDNEPKQMMCATFTDSSCIQTFINILATVRNDYDICMISGKKSGDGGGGGGDSSAGGDNDDTFRDDGGGGTATTTNDNDSSSNAYQSMIVNTIDDSKLMSIMGAMNCESLLLKADGDNNNNNNNNNNTNDGGDGDDNNNNDTVSRFYCVSLADLKKELPFIHSKDNTLQFRHYDNNNYITVHSFAEDDASSTAIGLPLKDESADTFIPCDTKVEQSLVYEYEFNAKVGELRNDLKLAVMYECNFITFEVCVVMGVISCIKICFRNPELNKFATETIFGEDGSMDALNNTAANQNILMHNANNELMQYNPRIAIENQMIVKHSVKLSTKTLLSVLSGMSDTTDVNISMSRDESKPLRLLYVHPDNNGTFIRFLIALWYDNEEDDNHNDMN
jgi:hypothetical protein